MVKQFVFFSENKECEREVFIQMITEIGDPNIQETCIRATTDRNMELNCECWENINQTWLYENFDCYWNQDDDQTLLEDYMIWCLVERNKTYTKSKSIHVLSVGM